MIYGRQITNSSRLHPNWIHPIANCSKWPGIRRNKNRTQAIDIEMFMPPLSIREYGFVSMTIFKGMDMGIFLGGFPKKAGMEKK